MSISKSLLSLVILTYIFAFSSCKEISKENLYELKDAEIKQNVSSKKFVKSDIEFLSVVYSDLFGKTIPTEESKVLQELYNSCGDRKTIVDMVIRNYLNKPNVIVPNSSEMKKDIPKFVSDCYKKFYIRNATQYELNYLTSKIEKNPNITPEMLYYSFLTSNEYKFF